MFRKFRKAVGCIIAAAVMTVVSVTASADYIYDLNNTDLLDEIKATDYEIYGTEGRFTATLGDSTEEKYVSLRFKLFNEYLDQEFWESDDARVSVDVKLETAGNDVIACIPGFNNKWGWVNPSDYTPLKSGEWVTVTEKASHFHEEFAKVPRGIREGAARLPAVPGKDQLGFAFTGRDHGFREKLPHY